MWIVESRIIFISLCLILFANSALGRMEALTDGDLDSVSAQSGISIFIQNVDMDIGVDSLTIYDATPERNTIAFENISMLGTTFDTISPITFDVFTIDDSTHPMNGETFCLQEASDWDQMVDIDVGNLVFCDQDIGSLYLGTIKKPSFYHLSSGHGDGYDFEHGVQLSVDTLSYNYRIDDPTTTTVDESLSFNLTGISLVGSFTDNPNDDPSDPATWISNGQFKIGDISTGNSASIDVATAISNGDTFLAMNLPMSGSIRIENMQFGSRDFGPCAIDGLQVHRLELLLLP